MLAVAFVAVVLVGYLGCVDVSAACGVSQSRRQLLLSVLPMRRFWWSAVLLPEIFLAVGAVWRRCCLYRLALISFR